VGTGFSGKELARLQQRLDPLRRPTNPFTVPPPKKTAVFVEPEVVVEVEFRERTDTGILRHPSYKGERTDKTVADLQP
jgi:bifunctional non-homologous end joining protein LigD